jgi:digeranylgeranylglycerophospholipid reductase
MHDVIIVGAGPAGTMCASLLEESDLDVLVIEKKSIIGVPVQCSGLVSKNLDRFVSVPGDCIEHEVRGAIVHGPGGEDIELRKPGTAAYVINRELFDKFMAGRIKSRILLKTEARGIVIGKDKVKVSTSRGYFVSRALIGCDGPGSVVRRHFGVEPPEIVQGIIAITSEKDDSDHVELWLDRDECDGFLWRIPRKERVEYGMLGTGVKFRQLERFFRLGDGYKKSAGLIPMGGCRSYFDRTLLVGDAAAQTKPWSGGGIIYGFTCANHAANTLQRALKDKDLSQESLKSYEDIWRNEIGKPISIGMMARELYKEIDERGLSELFRKLASRDLNSLDMDFPLIGF